MINLKVPGRENGFNYLRAGWKFFKQGGLKQLELDESYFRTHISSLIVHLA
jgi:hypothetical protein